MTRLDVILVNKGLVSTRTRAEQVITTHGVLVEGILVTKPGKKYPDEVTLQLIEDEIPWVSKGAIKLLAAIEKWSLSAAHETCLDIGASTGGFTEVLLQLGAKKVYAVDVGQHQLHSKLRNDNRIVNLEKTHVRELTKNLVYDVIDFLVVDVSFISLTKVLPFLHPFLKNGAKVVLLIKPQFEVGKENLNKNGIVVNKLLYPEITEKIKTSARHNQLEFIDIIDSPILGGDGNREFLAYFCKANEC
ncbi:MAG: TlyA family RNA methyltransferase [Crocinitomicaceae bacterium]